MPEETLPPKKNKTNTAAAFQQTTNVASRRCSILGVAFGQLGASLEG